MNFGPFLLGLCQLCGPSETNRGEVDCISAGHGDADLWVLIWSKVGECMEREVKMSLENRQVAWANEKADE